MGTFDLTGIVALIRPINSLMVGFAVLVGIAVASPASLISLPSLLGFLTGFSIAGYSMIVNDYYDLEVDRVNQPMRPLPSGAVSSAAALLLAAILLIIGISASTLTSFNNLIVAATFAFIAWLYNFWGKKRGIVGNMMVAASVAIPYIYGGMAVGSPDRPLLIWLTLTSFLATMGREVIKTIADVVGDEARGIRSVARAHGPRVASKLGAIMFISAMASSWIPFITGIVGFLYAALIIIPNVIFLYATMSILREASKGRALRVKNLALKGMLLGLIAFIVGGTFAI